VYCKLLNLRYDKLTTNNSKYGGSGAPDDNGYTKIYSTYAAFAALKADGSITAWAYSS
jgi:hypothetical protein